MLDARTAAIDWAARSLAYELNEPAPLCEDRAETLVAIAEHYEVPDENLIIWIHLRGREDKDYSAANFRAWCELWRELYAQTKQESEESWEASQALSDMRERFQETESA